MLTLKQIIAATAKYGFDRFDKAGSSVKATSLKFGRSKSLGYIRAVCKAWSEKSDKGWSTTKYVTYVDFIDDKDHVKVACTCPDFMFTWSFALHRKGAADDVSNGESPDVRNPAKVAGFCKHCIKLVDLLVAKGKLDSQFRLR